LIVVELVFRITYLRKGYELRLESSNQKGWVLDIGDFNLWFWVIGDCGTD